MTVGEMLTRISSAELSAWQKLYQVRHEEAEHQRHLEESGDGQVIVHGRDDGDEDDD